jgi:hypothetical protein
MIAAHNDNSSRAIFEIAQNLSELKSIRTAPAEGWVAGKIISISILFVIGLK